MDDSRADTIDRLLASDLSAPEQRRLAQAALDDDELFDALIAGALAQSALHSPRRATDRPEQPPPRVTRRWWPALITLGATAAALILIITYLRREPRVAEPAAVASATPSPAAVAKPVLLVARTTTEAPPVFRADVEGRRWPKAAGSVVGARDELIDLDLGSIDGVSQGMQVRVAPAGARDTAHVRITTVFRERSRGRLVGAGSVRPGDHVVIDPTVHVQAILEEATAREAAGDDEGARQLMEVAVKAAGPSVSADLRRQASERLGAALNQLGTSHIEKGAYAEAERTLSRAGQYAEGATQVRVANNLGAVKALQGDRAAAESLYRRALSLAGDSAQLASERASIQNNLSAVTTVR